jgi:biopolymer transport protein ExbB/TolQ
MRKSYGFAPGMALAASVLLIAPTALARHSGSDPVFSKIPPSDRLTLLAVYSDAAPVMKLAFSGLILAVIVALTVWLFQLVQLARRRSDSVTGAIAYLSGQAAAAPLFGLLGMSYGLVTICIGITNKRPGPTLLALAPGLAEALLSLGLGILAAAIATVAHHHLTARLRGIANA